MSKRILLYGLVVTALGLAGCAHLGARVQRGALPTGAPRVEAVLDDLAANDAAFHGVRAAGTFTVKAPDLAGTQRFDGAVYFRKPSDLRVVGRNIMGMKVFELVCVGKAFLVKTRKGTWYSPDGEQIQGITWKVSPADIAREMFTPEAWATLKRHQVRIVAYDAAEHKATLLIGPPKKPRRRVEVTGPPWDVTKDELYDEATGAVTAVTVLGQYHEQNGVRFPAHVDASFPKQDTELTFNMRNIRLNTVMDDTLFKIAKPTDENSTH